MNHDKDKRDVRNRKGYETEKEHRETSSMGTNDWPKKHTYNSKKDKWLKLGLQTYTS